MPFCAACMCSWSSESLHKLNHTAVTKSLSGDSWGFSLGFLETIVKLSPSHEVVCIILEDHAVSSVNSSSAKVYSSLSVIDSLYGKALDTNHHTRLSIQTCQLCEDILRVSTYSHYRIAGNFRGCNFSRKCLQKKSSWFLFSWGAPVVQTTHLSLHVRTLRCERNLVKIFVVFIFAVTCRSAKTAKICTSRKFPAIQYVDKDHVVEVGGSNHEVWGRRQF